MSKVKTLFLFEEIPNQVFLFELEGDYRHLDDVFINVDGRNDKQKQDELINLIYKDADDIDDSDKGYLKVIRLEAPTRDWTYFVRTGIIL